MLEGIDAVFFDLDGTLIDSMWVWKQIDVDYLERFHIKVPDDLHEHIEGMSFTQTAEYFKKRFHIPDDVEQIKSEWNNMAYDNYIHNVPLKEGILDFLDECKIRGLKTGIASSNSRELVRAILHTHHITEMFDSIITSCEVRKGKPAPDIYQKSAKAVFAENSRCLVFEDVTMGILAGKRAGMKVCAVWDAFSDFQLSKKKEYADYYIHDYTEVLNGSYQVLKTNKKDILKPEMISDSITNNITGSRKMLKIVNE